MGAAMTAPTCPHCGAERSERKSVVEFECGTTCFRDGTHVRDWVCYERQLAQQAAEIERYQKVLGDIGDKAHDLSTGPEVWDGYWDIRRMAYDAI